MSCSRTTTRTTTATNEERLHGCPVEHALDQVGVTEKVRERGIGWPGVHVLRRVALADLARPHDGNLAGQRQRLVLVVRHEQRGGASFAQHRPDVGSDARAERGVERAERLIEQDEGGLDGKRAG